MPFQWRDIMMTVLQVGGSGLGPRPLNPWCIFRDMSLLQAALRSSPRVRPAQLLSYGSFSSHFGSEIRNFCPKAYWRLRQQPGWKCGYWPKHHFQQLPSCYLLQRFITIDQHDNIIGRMFLNVQRHSNCRYPWVIVTKLKVVNVHHPMRGRCWLA